mgnify:CR=1 FL=1
MKTRLRNSLEIAEKKYCDFMSLNTEDFWTNNGFEERRNHIKIFSEIILFNSNCLYLGVFIIVFISSYEVQV